MKITASLLFLALTTLSASAGNWFGAGPWSNYGPYPGYLNGRYTGIVSAANRGDVISGVIGFAIVDGAPPFRIEDDQTTSGGTSPVPIVNQQIEPDPVQNYFAIFVEGRTYTGLTWPAIDLESNRVAGTLQGRTPAGFIPLGPDAGDIVFNAADALPVVNRGLSGAFNAAILNKNALFNFRGNGNLSTPANRQTIELETIITPAPIAIGDPATNMAVTGRVITESTPFTIRGIRSSLLTPQNPASLRDAREFQQQGQ
jgi:hypothetical protein